jgi:hypothetical protein
MLQGAQGAGTSPMVLGTHHIKPQIFTKKESSPRQGIYIGERIFLCGDILSQFDGICNRNINKIKKLFS